MLRRPMRSGPSRCRRARFAHADRSRASFALGSTMASSGVRAIGLIVPSMSVSKAEGVCRRTSIHRSTIESQMSSCARSASGPPLRLSSTENTCKSSRPPRSQTNLRSRHGVSSATWKTTALSGTSDGPKGAPAVFTLDLGVTPWVERQRSGDNRLGAANSPDQ